MNAGTAAATSTPPVKLPNAFIWGTLLLCAGPLLLNLLGIDFGTPDPLFDRSAVSSMTAAQLNDRMHHALSGSFTHTILEWSASLAAVFTVVFAFAHFVIKRDVTTPIISIALFWAACMDAFHVMTADRLISAVAENSTLIPFTWAMCRFFNALILLVGVGFFVVRKKPVSPRPAILLSIGLVFGAAAYALIHICATTTNLPVTTFPSAIVKRPYDLIPLALYLVAGFFVLPLFHRKHPSLFSSALMLSIVPQVATQLYMVFGAPALYDNHFNIAHFLKAVAYIIPFLGLLLDYIHTHRAEQRVQRELQEHRDHLEHEVAARTSDLTTALTKLETANHSLWSEINLAQKIQTVLLPQKSQIRGYEISALMRPAADVGGDYYDIVQTIGGKDWLFVGDVSGHGVTAGLIMMMIQTSIHTVLQQDRSQELSPARLLDLVNASVRSNLQKVSAESYMTITAMRLDGDAIKYAGQHQDILIYRKEKGAVERVETRGVWLGIVEDTKDMLVDDTLAMDEGDIMLLYTDGVTEANESGRLLATGGLAQIFESAARAAQATDTIVTSVLDRLSGFTFKDDVTLMVVRCTAAGVAGR